MAKKPSHADTVAHLWNGGERRAAVEYANANKVPESKWPDGMAEHARRIWKR